MFPDDFDGAPVVAGTHEVVWKVTSADGLESNELVIEEFRFP